jgi:hypothetical protein
MAKTLSESLLHILVPLTFVLLFYFHSTANKQDVHKVIYLLLMTQALFQATFGLALLLWTLFRENLLYLQIVSLCLWFILISFTGYLRNFIMESIIGKAFGYVNFLFYGYMGIGTSEFAGIAPYACVYQTVQCNPMREYGFELFNKWLCFIVVVIHAFAFRLIALLFFVRTHNLSIKMFLLGR